MSDLQWKIEDGELKYRSEGIGGRKFWFGVDSARAATILQSAIPATQEKCAQVADAHVVMGTNIATCQSIASAIRSLKLTETGHE